MYLVMEVAAKQSTFPLYFYIVYAVGFMAALIIGSIALSRSQRSPGLEDKQSPDINPETKTEEKSN